MPDPRLVAKAKVKVARRVRQQGGGGLLLGTEGGGGITRGPSSEAVRQQLLPDTHLVAKAKAWLARA